MGRRYAGILGGLAFVTVVTRGLLHGAGVNTTLSNAVAGFFGFAALGYVLGAVAAWIVLDSVRTELARRRAAMLLPAARFRSKREPRSRRLSGS